MLTLLPQCEKHPRYRVTRKPKSDCELCWARWFRCHSIRAAQMFLRLKRKEDAQAQRGSQL